jgi:uncharacterized protein
VVRKTFRFSTDSLSLKTIEKVYGQSHGGGDVKTAADSIVQYERVIKERMNGNFAEAERILKNIYDYNELDCLSTKQLDDWLREEAKKQNIEFVIKNIKSDSEDSDDENENIHPIEEKINLLKLYLEGAKDKKWSDEDIRGLEILLGSINFHYQEKLPAWWQHFERVKAEPEELINDDSVVYIEKAESGDWSKEGRQRNYRRFTRVISNGYGLSDVFSPGDEVHSLYDSPIPAQCLTLIDSERGYEKAKIIANDFGWGIEETTKSGSEGWPQTPVAVLPGPPIDTKNLTKALIELADLTIQRLEQGLTPFENQNWSDLARRMKPRTLGNKPLPREGNDIKDVIRAIEISDNSYVAVQGPPGSGKTFLGTRVIAELIKLGYKIGIVAQSHAVIENFLDKLYELDSSLPIAKKQHNENIQNKPWHTQKIEVFANLQNAGYAIGGTTWNFSRDVIKELNLDLMVIEEAGQFALANTLIVASRAKKTLLLGDPQQLEQVSQASHMYPVDKSALGHILDKHKTIPDDWGYFLSKTYRMHSKLTKPVSILQYENRLVSASVTDERELEEVDPGLKKLTLNHSGNTTRSEEEVEKIIKLIQQLVGKNWTENNSTKKLRQEDILIVAPYNNQVRSIKQALVKNELKKVRVGTVDKFQGQEAPVSILSMTTSSGEDLPRGIEFLLQANRLNVGISRAMWASFIIYSKELLNINPTTADAVQRLGAFIGLIQNAQEWEQ